MCSHRMLNVSLDIEPGFLKSPISAKTEQNADFEQNLVFFFDLSTLNHCKRSKRGLRFVRHIFRSCLHRKHWHNARKQGKNKQIPHIKLSKGDKTQEPGECDAHDSEIEQVGARYAKYYQQLHMINLKCRGIRDIAMHYCITQPPIICVALHYSIESQRTVFRADNILPVPAVLTAPRTWGRPQSLQGWF